MQKNGFEIVGTSIIKDNEESLEDAIKEAMKISDIVLVSGGSSKGEKD